MRDSTSMRRLLRPSSSPAIIDAATGVHVSYDELIAASEVLGKDIGAERQLVFISCRNDLPTLTAYAAAMLGGHAVALIDGATDPEALVGLIADYRPSVVMGSGGLADSLRDAGFDTSSSSRATGLDIVRPTSGTPPELHPELSLLLSTSGTTGSRKFVRLASRSVLSNAQAIATYLELTPAERPITSLPLHYTFGLSVVNSHWLAGAAVVVTDQNLIQPTFWEAFRTYGCTSLAGVPFSFRILERTGFRDMDLPSLSSLQQAGGALEAELTQVYAEFMSRRGGRFYVMYGQTEATARIAYVPPASLPAKLGSAGLAIPGGSLLIEPQRQDAAGHEVGEVVYEGPNVMLGYATGADDLALGDELGGTLRTGDIGYLDDDGYLYLVGRQKRIAKVFGHRISLDEVEAMLGQHGPVAVVDGGESIRAYCAFRDANSAVDALAQRLHLHRSAIVVREVDELPLTTSGKLDYEAIRSWEGDPREG